MAKTLKIDQIIKALEEWSRGDPMETKFPGPLSSVLKAKKELEELKEKAWKYDELCK